MKIYVINLVRSSERKEIFDKYNSKYITYEYIEAVDGKELDKKNLNPEIINDKCIFPDGYIGNALSHLTLWQKCIELDEPIIIMEDDTIVHNNFNTYLETILKQLPADFDILQLCYNFDHLLSYQTTNYEIANTLFDNKKITKEDIELFRVADINPCIAKLYHCFGISCYIISPRGAKTMIQNCFPLTDGIVFLPLGMRVRYNSIDCIMNSGYKQINAYVSLLPFAMVPHGADFNPSTI
jgi:GR25 family glycosyltransferase involved in LPS biosynthesis